MQATPNQLPVETGQAAPVLPMQQPAQVIQVTPTNVPVQTQPSRLKETVIWGLVGAAGVVGLIFLGKKVIHDLVSGREETKSMDTDSVAFTAKQIRMAFDNDGWWGTDEVKLRGILREVSDQQEWDEIGKSYARNYGTKLMTDLESDLTSSEFSEMMAIINSKPKRKGEKVNDQKVIENWAQRMYEAFSVYYGFFPGTDEDAVKSVITEIPTQSAFKQMEDAYQRMYGSSFMDDLQGDMWDWADYMEIIKRKPL